MKYKAIVSFSGLKLSMRAGEVREISDLSLVNDLLRAHYIISFEEDKKEVVDPVSEEPEKKVEKKTSTKGKGKKEK